MGIKEIKKKKTELRFLEMKNTMPEIKAKLDRMNGKVDIVGEKSHELKSQQQKTSQNKHRRRNFKHEKIINETWENFKQLLYTYWNIHVRGENGYEKRGGKKVFVDLVNFAYCIITLLLRTVFLNLTRNILKMILYFKQLLPDFKDRKIKGNKKN